MAERMTMTTEQVVGYLLEGEGLDFLRESLAWVVQQLMEAEVSELVGAAAVAQAEELRPDVALMDIRMPELNGIEATRRLVDRTSTRVLMLTTFDLDEYVYEAMNAGASGFLLKDVRPEQLAETVRVIA